MQVSYSGFGSIPPNSTNRRPASAERVCSYTPLRRIEPPPYTHSTAASSGSRGAISRIIPSPNRISVGFR